MTELVELINKLIIAIELAQSRGAYKLEESKIIYDTIMSLKNYSKPNLDELTRGANLGPPTKREPMDLMIIDED